MKASLSFLHHQGQDWLRELAFFKDEIAVLTTRLEEVAKNNTATETLAQIEHFQNKFVMLREQLDILKHDINLQVKDVEEIVKTKPEHINEKFSATNDATLERVKDFSLSIANTRFEFNKFLSKTM
jgi:hypothetical protein